MMQKLPFLKVKGTQIIDSSGAPVMLNGVNLGGWLMMEGYMLSGRNIAEKTFKESFEKALGREAVEVGLALGGRDRHGPLWRFNLR